ncbi:TonB-dependent receptor [Marilutibacter spongiae]|uniref:TonB-dependent receptor n=1 Tax=Marilutibacter spongiae TaxID=2025720 RepID=A0A7W3Y771_9GAMM|nr:TonB-dependent receptor [Lysobacter spongiae]MBB1061666.1 TonB-dependent receptor [Lysobacter spongiae]
MNMSKPTPALRRTPLVGAVACALALAAATPAIAQEAGTPEAPADATAPAAPQRAVDLDTVMVTANKRVENIREVPSAISVIGGARIEQASATQLSDYSDYVPGLNVSAGGTPGKTTVSMRGIAPLSSGSTVGTYIDETPVGSSGLYQAATILALDLLPYDIDRVEVQRGPQGTLYGAGSMGGLLKYVTVAPDTTATEFRIGGGLSSVGDGGTGHNVRFGANLPLVRDSLALRLSYSRNDAPGYIDNAVDGEEDINDVLQTSARAALMWQGERASLKLSAMRQTIDSDNNAFTALDPADGSPLDGDLENRVWVDEVFRKDIDYYAATLEVDFGWADFTSATGYSETDTLRRQDTTVAYGNFADLALGLPEGGSSYFDNGLQLDKFTQEFRLTSKAGSPLEWMLGVFHTKEEGGNSQLITLNQLDGSPLPAPYDDIAGTLALLYLPTDYKETAVFANASYAFTDRFKLGAGVRYAENDQTFSQNVVGGILLPLGESPNGSSEDVFTWSVTPQYKLGDDSMLYGKVATGYQPGGPNVLLPGVPASVDSSTLTSYELGLKSGFADNRLLIDLAAYKIDWEDIQVVATFNGASGLVNGGTATSQGLEFAAQYRPTADFHLGFNAAYTDADLTQDFPTLVIPSPPYVVQVNSGLKGDRMPYVPKYSFSTTADYYFDVGDNWQGALGAGLRWIDDRVGGTTERQVITTDTTPPTVLDTTITPPLELDSYYSLDLHASLSNANWSFRAYVKNATDQRGYTSISSNDNQVTGATASWLAAPILPRTFGIEVDYRF